MAEHCDCSSIYTCEMCQLRSTLAEAERRLEEATELLNSWTTSIPPLRGARPTAATRAFLSGAPAREAEPSPRGFAYCERCKALGGALCGICSTVKQHRAESAESTLAAVREKLGKLHLMNSRDAGQVYCASAVDEIAELCTTAPATGEDGT